MPGVGLATEGKGAVEMYGLNAFSLLAFLGMHGILWGLCAMKAALRRRVVRLLCVMLLGSSVVAYGCPPLWGGSLQFPVEFSTVAYFVTPAILLAGKGASRNWAAYAGWMAGFFYYFAMIFAGGALYRTYPTCEVYASLLRHGVLYVLGVVTVATESLPPAKGGKLLLGLALIGIQALLLRPWTDESQRIFIYILLDAEVVRKLFSPDTWGIALALYYGAVAGVLWGTVAFFSTRGRRTFRQLCGLERRLRLAAA